MKLIKPPVAIRLTACALIIIGMANLFMHFWPVVVINTLLSTGEGLEPSRFRESFQLFAEQVAESNSLGTRTVFYLSVVALLVSCIYIVSGVLLFLRKAWVRRPLLGALAVMVLWFIGNNLILASTTGRHLPSMYSVLICLVLPLALLYRFTRADAKQLFAGRT